MTFEEYWVEVDERGALLNSAIKQLPFSLSVETKRKLKKLSAEETIEILEAVIDEVNHGSVDSIDNLVRKIL